MSVVTSGLCTNQGKEWPEGARVTELVWGQLRTRSGAKAWSTQEGLELDNWSRWRRRFTKLVLHLRLLAGGGRNRNQD